MPKSYNVIYSHLVENEFDVVGHIAYSLYKQEKIDYIEKKKESTGKSIKDKDLVSFHDFSSTKSSIESYRLKAEMVVQGLLDNTLKESIEDIERQRLTEQTEELKNIVSQITPSFFDRMLSGLASAFIFALLLALLAMILKFRGSIFKFELITPEEQNTTSYMYIDKNVSNENIFIL